MHAADPQAFVAAKETDEAVLIALDEMAQQINLQPSAEILAVENPSVAFEMATARLDAARWNFEHAYVNALSQEAEYELQIDLWDAVDKKRRKPRKKTPRSLTQAREEFEQSVKALETSRRDALQAYVDWHWALIAYEEYAALTTWSGKPL